MKGYPLSIGAQGEITAADLNADGIDELIVSNKDSTLIYNVEGQLIGGIPSYHHPAYFFDNPPYFEDKAGACSYLFFSSPCSHELYRIENNMMSIKGEKAKKLIAMIGLPEICR